MSIGAVYRTNDDAVITDVLKTEPRFQKHSVNSTDAKGNEKTRKYCPFFLLERLVTDNLFSVQSSDERLLTLEVNFVCVSTDGA